MPSPSGTRLPHYSLLEASPHSFTAVAQVVFEDELAQVFEAGVVGAALVGLGKLPHEVLQIRIKRSNGPRGVSILYSTAWNVRG